MSKVCIVLLSVFAVASLCFAELHQIQHVLKEDGDLRFLALGDWGREGHFNQTRIAEQMGTIAAKFNIEFVISTGDNFYDEGLDSVLDQKFKNSYKDIYTAESLQKPWYLVLGNHDYMGDVFAQLSPELKRRDNRWNCYRSYVVNTEVADFFFVDTTPFVDWYFTTDNYDQRGLTPSRTEYIAKLLKDLCSALENSNAPWKFVIGHHTIRSAGGHGDTIQVQQQLLPILNRYNVDFYVNGHDHCMQHVVYSLKEVQFVTSGGGSRAWGNTYHPLPESELKFYYDGQGFMMANVIENGAYIAFYNIDGEIIHEWMTDKYSDDP